MNQIDNNLKELRYIKIEDIERNISIYDLGAAAYLITIGVNIYSLDKASNNKKIKFVFENMDGFTMKQLSNYWSNNCVVNPRTYFDNIKMLKNRIYSA